MAVLKADLKVNSSQFLKDLINGVKQLEIVKTDINEINKKDINTSLNIDTEIIDGVKSEIADIDDKSVNIDIDADPSNIHDVKSEIADIDDKSVNIDVDADPSAIKGLASEIDNLDVSAGTAKKSIIKLGSGVGIKMSKSMGLAIAGFQKLKGVVGDFIDSANIQIKAENDLRMSLEQTGQFTESNFQKFKEYASSLQETTVFGDEATLSLLSLSNQLGFLGDESIKATETAYGLATQFEAFNVKPEMALRALRRAQEGNFTMLQQWIPQLQGVTDETEKWAIINEQAANGMLRAGEFAETTEGRMIQFQNAIGDLKEELGFFAIDVIQSFMPVLKQITDVGAQLIPIITSALTPLIEIVEKSLTPLFTVLIDLVSDVLESIMPVLNEILSGLTPILETLSKLLQEVLMPIIQVLTPLIQLITTLLAPALQIISGLLNVLANIIRITVTPIIVVLSNVIQIIVDIFQNLITYVSDTIGEFVDLTKVSENFSKMTDKLLQNVINRINDFYESIRPVIEIIQNILYAVVKYVLSYIITQFQILWKAVNIVYGIFEKVVSYLHNFFRPAIDFVGKIIDKLFKQFRQLADGIGNLARRFGLLKKQVDDIEINNLVTETDDLNESLEGTKDVVTEINDGFSETKKEAEGVRKETEIGKKELIEQLVTLRLIGATSKKHKEQIKDIVLMERERAQVLKDIKKELTLFINDIKEIETIDIDYNVSEPVLYEFEKKEIIAIDYMLPPDMEKTMQRRLINEASNTGEIISNLLFGAPIDDRLLNERLASIDYETEYLQRQLELREISQNEYNNRVLLLEERRSQVQSSYYAKTSEELQTTLKNAFTNIEIDSNGNIKEIGKNFNELLDVSGEIFGAIGDLAITNFAQLNEQGSLQFESLQQTLESLGAVSVQMGKDMALSLARAYIPSMAGLIMSLIPPPFGQVTATLAIAYINSLINKHLGAEEGVIGINKNYNKKKGKTDNILLWINENESVINASATRRERPLLETINKGGTSIDYFKEQFIKDKHLQKDLLRNINLFDVINTDKSILNTIGIKDIDMVAPDVNNSIKNFNREISKYEMPTNNQAQEVTVKNEFGPLKLKGKVFESYVKKVDIMKKIRS